MHRTLFEYFVIVVIVLDLFWSLESPFYQTTGLQTMLYSKFNEVNNIFAFIICMIAPPELVIQSLVNILIVFIVFIENVFIRFYGKHVVKVMLWLSWSCVLIFVFLIWINWFPLSSHCWISWLDVCCMIFQWIFVLFFIWSFFNLIHVWHWSITIRTFFIIIILSSWLYRFILLLNVLLSRSGSTLITFQWSERWCFMLLVKSFISSKIVFWKSWLVLFLFLLRLRRWNIILISSIFITPNFPLNNSLLTISTLIKWNILSRFFLLVSLIIWI